MVFFAFYSHIPLNLQLIKPNTLITSLTAGHTHVHRHCLRHIYKLLTVLNVRIAVVVCIAIVLLGQLTARVTAAAGLKANCGPSTKIIGTGKRGECVGPFTVTIPMTMFSGECEPAAGSAAELDQL